MTGVPTWKKILPIVLPSIVEAENFSDHPRSVYNIVHKSLFCCIVLLNINGSIS